MRRRDDAADHVAQAGTGVHHLEGLVENDLEELCCLAECLVDPVCTNDGHAVSR